MSSPEKVSEKLDTKLDIKNPQKVAEQAAPGVQIAVKDTPLSPTA